jgi:uncharacterized protein
VCFSNRECPEKILNSVNNIGFMMKALLLIGFTFSFYSVAAQEESPVRESLAKQFFDNLVEKQFLNAVSLFDSAAVLRPSPDALGRSWRGITTQVGNYQSSPKTSSHSIAGNNFVIITCQFEKASLDLKISFNNQDKINSIVFLPTRLDDAYEKPPYVKKRKFKEKEVYFKAGDFLIPGTLTLPRCGRKLPLVVLVHGSGPTDRDLSMGPNKMFRDLAWGLASKKIAVLRYDKRTYLYAAKIAEIYGNRFTINEEIISDAIGAIEFGRTVRRKVNPENVFVLGHDLGGMMAPRIASMNTKLSGIIVMAGCARPYEDLVLEQVRYLGAMPAVNGTNAEPISIEKLERQVALVKHPLLTIDAPASELPLGLSAHYWLDLKNYNQISSARSSKKPMLFLHGENDSQVTVNDFNIWKNGLKTVEHAQFKAYGGLNHYFVETSEGSEVAGTFTAGPVSHGVVKDIIKWIKNPQKKVK